MSCVSTSLDAKAGQSIGVEVFSCQKEGFELWYAFNLNGTSTASLQFRFNAYNHCVKLQYIEKRKAPGVLNVDFGYFVQDAKLYGGLLNTAYHTSSFRSPREGKMITRQACHALASQSDHVVGRGNPTIL